MITIDSGVLFLIILVLCATGLGITWLLVRREKRDGEWTYPGPRYIKYDDDSRAGGHR